MFVGVLSTDDSGRQNGISWCQACGDDKRAEEGEVGYQSIDEGGADKPAIGHDGDEQEKEGAPVFKHILLRQFDTNGKYTDGKHNSGDLQGDFVHYFMRVCPTTGIKYPGNIWPNDDAENSRNYCFADVGLTGG